MSVEKKAEPMGRDPVQTFFMPVILGNADGTFELGMNVQEAYDTYEEAEAEALSDAKKFGCKSTIFACKAVARVGGRGKVIHIVSD